MSKYGFADDAWEQAKKQARDVLIDVAKRKELIAYSALVARISAITLDHHSYAMRDFLNEISTAEHDAGRGLLSVVVVYKHGEQKPGPGFFQLARTLGYTYRDESEFWVAELNKVYRVWSPRG